MNITTTAALYFESKKCNYFTKKFVDMKLYLTVKNIRQSRARFILRDQSNWSRAPWRNITNFGLKHNFRPIKVNGWIFSGIFPLKNLQISQTSLHSPWKLLHSLKVCVLKFFAKYYLKLTVQGIKENLNLFDHIFFIDQKFLATEHKLVQTSSNRFYQSVISDCPCVTIAKPFEVSNFWHAVISYLVVRFTNWTLVRIFWAYFCFCHL